jgi:cell division protein FtsN
MAKPAKPAARGRAKGNFLLGVFVGLAVGLGIALGVAFYLNKTPIPFLSKPKPATKESVADSAKAPAISGLPTQPAVAAKSPEKPKFDFYKILPGGEEPVSDKDLKAAAKAAAAAKGQPDLGKDVYFIQAGSFQNPADADNQKARLAILGIESSVEPAEIPDKGTRYRVRLGPFAKLEDLNRVRATLAQNGIDANMVKIKQN